MKAKRILHVVSAMHRGGAETMIMNLYRNIDREKIQFDFISHVKGESDYDEEIRNLGGRIIKIESLGKSGPIKYIMNLKKVIEEFGPFEVVHSHTNMQAGFVHIAAKLAGIKKRITHSHNTNWNKSHNLFKPLMKKMSTKFCACGIEAGIKAFGKKNFEKGKVSIFNNGIDLEKFTEVDNQKVLFLKNELGIKSDVLLIGHIGRFCEQKNHDFIIKIANVLKNQKKDFMILMLGKGPLEREIKNKVKMLDLEKRIKFLGIREDIDVFMRVLDVFILPSHHEGFPLVLVEAQASGTRCIISDKISTEVDFGLGLIQSIGIDDDSLEEWTFKISEEKKNDINKNKIFEVITNHGFNAKNNVEKLMSIYDIETNQ